MRRAGGWLPTPRLLAVQALCLLATVAWTVAALHDGGSLHEAPVVLLGPDVVTTAIIETATQFDAAPLSLGNTESPDVAAAALAENSAVAVVAIDLRGEVDLMTLNPRGDERRDVAVVDLVAELEAGYGRELLVERDGRPWTGGSDGLPIVGLALVATLAGFLAAVVLSLVRGPSARSFRAGVGRFVVLIVLGTGAGLLLTLLRPSGVDAATAATALCAAAIAGALVTTAAEALAGYVAVGIAAMVLLGLPLPLVVAGDPFLLDSPWSRVTDWTIVGAASSAAVAGSGRTGIGLPSVVLGGSIAVAVAVLLLRRAMLSSRPGSAPEPPDDEPTPAPIRRPLVVLSAAAVAFTVVTFSAWEAGIDDAPPQTITTLASSTTCVPTGPVRSVADLNAIIRLRSSERMRGGDVGASAALQDGRQIWLFADTLRDAGTEGGSFVHNSALVTGAGCLRVVVPDSGGAVIPDRADGVGYWPMSLVVEEHPGYDLVTVLAQRVRVTDADDVFGFETLGPAVASFVVAAGATPQLLSVTDLGADDAATTRPTWGAASALHDGWLYLYGTARPEDAAPGTGFSLRVARVRPDDVTRTRAWRYWDGGRWVAGAANARELVPARGGVSQTLSVFQRGGTWFLFSKRDEVLGQDLVFWSSSRPTGPFVAQEPVGALPSDATRGVLRYMPLAHPELLPEPDSMVVSYSRNRLDSTEVFEDPLRYRIRFLRVALPLP